VSKECHWMEAVSKGRRFLVGYLDEFCGLYYLNWNLRTSCNKEKKKEVHVGNYLSFKNVKIGNRILTIFLPFALFLSKRVLQFGYSFNPSLIVYRCLSFLENDNLKREILLSHGGEYEGIL
jgi:hypothetical protein